MPIYAVQRKLPGITLDQLAGAQKKVIETSDQFTRDGQPVKYIRSNFYPKDSKCTCLFEGPDAKVVQQVNETAAIPFDTIEEVLDLIPE